jgi:hypothetical protein
MPLLSDKGLAPAAIRVLTELADSPAERVAVTPQLAECTAQLLAKLANRQDLSARRKAIVDAWARVRRVLG